MAATPATTTDTRASDNGRTPAAWQVNMIARLTGPLQDPRSTT